MDTIELITTCKLCGQPIKFGEPVKIAFNADYDEHISCPKPEEKTEAANA